MEDFQTTPEPEQKPKLKLWKGAVAVVLVAAVGFGVWSMASGGEGGQGMIFKKDFSAGTQQIMLKDEVSKTPVKKEDSEVKTEEKAVEKPVEKAEEKKKEEATTIVEEPAVEEVDYAVAFEGECPQGFDMDEIYDSREDNGEGYHYGAMHESFIREIDQGNGSTVCPYVFRLYEEGSSRMALEFTCENMAVGMRGGRRNEVSCSNELLVDDQNYRVEVSLLPAKFYGNSYDIPPYFNASLRFNNSDISYHNNAWSLKDLEIFRVNPEYTRSAFR